MPVLSVTSGTGLTLMPECRCRTDFFSIPAFRHHKHLDVQDVTLPAPAVWACRVYPNPLLAVRTCKVFISLFKFVQCFQNVFLKCRNVGLSGISSVRYRNNQKYWTGSSACGTGIRGYIPGLKCTSTRLNYRMPECGWQRHRPWYQCPAMVKDEPN
jgi:hypothetical protein